MNQNIWGPGLWLFLHTTTLNYAVKPSEEQKNQVREFFYSLGPILPCRYCRKNYARNLKEFPIRLDSKRELFEWLVDIHNEVNGLTGKRSYSYKEVIAKYDQIYQKKIDLDRDQKSHQLQIDLRIPLMVLLLAGFVVYYFYY